MSSPSFPRKRESIFTDGAESVRPRLWVPAFAGTTNECSDHPETVLKAARRNVWDKSSGRGARMWCWRPSSACRWMAAGSLRGASRRYVMQAAEASLRRLKTDWIDLYLLHRPDARTPIEETLRALDDLKTGGKNPLRRLLQSVRRAARSKRCASANGRIRRLIHLLSGRVQPARARSGKRTCLGAMRKHTVLSLLPLFPARQRPVDRQVQARRAAAAGLAARRIVRRAAAACSTRATGASSTALGRLRRRARPHAA